LVRKGSPLLFLVDEIFSGTNSIDRLTASEMLLKVWVGGGCMGIISTHDLALTEIAALFGSKAANAHFQNISEDNPLQFDYLLRPGVSTLRNGIAVARLIGLETPDMATPST
jgi:DNA mismatch repair ATPase MutS